MNGIGYKLFRKRRDGTLGPLFINKRQVIVPGVTYAAEDHPTKGYAHRPGWHLAKRPHAPHLTLRNRVWCMVEYTNGREYPRPESQGGCWILARTMRVLAILNP